MKVYVFGNSDHPQDKLAIDLSKELAKDFLEIEFVTVLPNEDVPFVGEDPVIIMDMVLGIDKVEIITGDKIDNLIFDSRATVHDYDLGFQLKYLKKLGKIGEVKIIGIPMNRPVTYDSIQSIFKKLVAQDIQGS